MMVKTLEEIFRIASEFVANRFPKQREVHRRCVEVKTIECLHDLVRQDLRQVADQLTHLRCGAAKIPEPMNHLERHAEIGLDKLLLSRVCIREPLADPVGEICERNLC